MKEFIAKHISSEFDKLSDHQKGTDGKQRTCFQHQEWMFLPPTQPSKTKTMNGREYRWRAKCNKGKGQWVQAHTTETHIDDFKPNGRRYKNTPPPGILRPGINTNADGKPPGGQPCTSFATPDKHHEELEPSAQLSLQDGLNNYFHFDVDEIADED